MNLTKGFYEIPGQNGVLSKLTSYHLSAISVGVCVHAYQLDHFFSFFLAVNHKMPFKNELR